MRDYVLMVDVNSDIDPAYAAAEGICIMPQYYHFNDGVIYGDEQKLSLEEFFSRLRTGERAYSMGCNPDRVHGIMEEAVKAGHDIIVTMASAECSGSYNTVCIEADKIMEDYPGSRIKVIDSRLECAPIALLVHYGQDLKKQGKSFDEVVEAMEKKKTHLDIYFMVDHLDYLVRGGRLSAISGAIGTLLSIKPILHFENGQIVPLMKVRGKKAAKQAMLEELRKKKLDPDWFCAGNTLNYDEAEEFAKTCADEFGLKILYVADINPTIGVHIGDGAFGVAFCTADEEE